MSTQNYVSKEQLLYASYGMVALTSIFAVARVATQFLRPKKLALEDFLVYLAFAFYIAMATMYIVVIPTMFRISDAMTGRAPPYPTLLDDALFMTRIFFANTTIFWLVLWTVKFSLLALYRRLMVGLRKRWIRSWWVVFVFCVLSLIGCIISNITSCHSMHAWWTPGDCTTPSDVRAQIASLYYAYAVDVLSDLMIMLLPIRLVMNVQMELRQKLGVIALFCTGLVCIVFATVRVIQVGVKAESSTTPSSSWLALWAVVECSIAFIIACCPVFYRLFNKTQPVSHNAPSYSYQRSSRSGARSSDAKLTSVGSSGGQAGSDPYWEVENGSQEELADRTIMVTITVKRNETLV